MWLCKQKGVGEWLVNVQAFEVIGIFFFTLFAYERWVGGQIYSKISLRGYWMTLENAAKLPYILSKN